MKKDREIKFRAWDKRENEMFTIDEFSFNEDGSVYAVKRKGFTSTGGFYTYPEKNNVILMQFTGLLDRHGKEIYEGDVVKYEVWERFHENESERTSTVEFNEKWAGWWPMVAHTVVDDGFYNWEIENIEITGNIYENPELLNSPTK